MTPSYVKTEMWELGTTPQFLHTAVYRVWEDEIRFILAPEPEEELACDELDWESSMIVPSNHLWPMPLNSTKIFDGPCWENIYCKGPDLHNYTTLQELGRTPAQLMIHEVFVYEQLLHSPDHPNICKFFGYQRGKDGRMKALCLARYNESLQERLEDFARPLDVEACVVGIRTGIDFLHDNGVVHNDLHIANVMLAVDDTPVIIDFDSAQLCSSPLGTKPGVDGTRTTARFENDLTAFSNIRWKLDQYRTELKKRQSCIR